MEIAKQLFTLYSNRKIENMTQTLTYSQAKQFHFLNIISVSEDKLQQNFQHILQRLSNTEKQLKHQKLNMEKLQQKLSTLSLKLQQKYEIDTKNMINLQNNTKQLNKLQKQLQTINIKINKNCSYLQQFSKIYQNMKLFIDRDYEARNIQCNNFKNKINNLQIQLESITKLLLQKQNISQTNKIKQNYQNILKNIKKLEQDNKFIQFKLDKFQVNNQKYQKSQLNKDIMMMKDLQQKIKNQIKGNNSCNYLIGNNEKILFEVGNFGDQSYKQINIGNQQNNKNITQSQVNSTQQNIKLSHLYQNKKKDFTSSINNNQNFQIFMNKINQTLLAHQRKIQRTEYQITSISQQYQQYIGNQKNKKTNVNQIQQKFNAIRPELNKIWGKCDTIQDKASFLERKMQQKNKQINNILQVLKQHQLSKFQQKIKSLQTQIFAIVKQNKIKLDGKINNNQFQKFSRSILDKIQCLNDTLILKSDKLQVKKALLFLQSKIKQVILVISEQEQNQKDALLTKKQIKCISCDKDIEKFLGTTNNVKGNWDAFPTKQHSADILGRFGMTKYGTLVRKLKKLDNKEILHLPNKRIKQSIHSQSDPKIDFN